VQSTGRSGIIATLDPGRNNMAHRRKASCSAALLALGAGPLYGQTGPEQGASAVPVPSIVVTATRSERNSFDLPVSIDRIDADAIREGKPMINLSESLSRVPGVVVQNRQNYSQDLQISSRGFGSRAQFGVRGVRLYADGIPATSPDGQGQTSNFDLGAAERIEVMRGPFSTLYGNASGGVIQVFTEDGPPEPTLTINGAAGSYGTSRSGLKFGGQSGALNYIGGASHLETTGYRDHSAAEKDLGNAKLKVALSDDTRVALILNSVRQPAQDPAGLSRAQVEQNPRQVNPTVIQFNTRKDVVQTQLGTTVEHRLSASDSLRFAAYGGSRQVEQFLALNGTTPFLSSGGVVNLDRFFYGLDLRWSRATELAGQPFAFTVGSDYDNQKERRRGYVNNDGTAGALKRDEDDKVRSAALYAEAEWKFASRWSLLAGLRHTEVSFYSSDYYIVPGPTPNPDDSGQIRFKNTSPVAGLVYSVSPTLNLYGNVGKGFETPTFAELAYRPDGTTGLNFALQPSTSVNTELGAKAFLPGGQRLTFAVFHIDTKDEIVVDTAANGRTTFKNASRTTRNGAEVSWSARTLETLDLLAALAYVDARYRDDFSSGTPPVPVSAGNTLPGVPRRTFYGEARWAPRERGFSTAFELRYGGRIYTTDANTASADPYTVVNWRIVFEQRASDWRVSEFLRIENLFDRNYIGSVIVGDANRPFEPAPRRNVMVGINAVSKF
jgi:iron complex outermembrane recepter protein